jgi:hypothetical protein
LEVLSGPVGNSIVNHTVGWSFHVEDPIRIDALGYFDFNGDGLNLSSEVGLWRDDGKLLATVAIPSGTSATLIDSFRFVSIDPLVLGPHDYVVGAVANTANTNLGDDLVVDLATIRTAPEITFIQNLASNVQSTSLQFPDTYFPTQGTGFFGPNLTFTRIPAPTKVPEPSTIVLTGIGLVSLWRNRRVERNPPRPALSSLTAPQPK